MAVLSKIRERSIFLITIIALALFAFVVQGAFKGQKSDNLIGEVDGEPITRQEFSKEIDLYRNRTGNRGSQILIAKNVWDKLIKEKIYQNQLKNAGISIGEEDVWDAIINLPNINNNPLFQNEAKLFDEEKFKEFLVNLKENSETDPNDRQWKSWLSTEQDIKRNLEQNIYSGLVLNGINTTLSQGKNYYLDQTTKSDIEYVFVPFRSIPDSLFKVTDKEVIKYVKARKKEFAVDATRDLVYVKFDINPTKDDEEIIKNEVASFLNDKDEYSSAAKTTIKVLGFKNTTDEKSFLIENNSDITYTDVFSRKSRLPQLIADSIMSAKEGDVIGPYKDREFYKLTKIKEFKQLPDSVKASHILISFKGGIRSTDQKTDEEAKKMADSIYKLVRNNKKKFTEIAKKVSYDKISGANGGELKWFEYRTMVPEFRDFTFFNKTGKVAVIKTGFGYHIIRIDAQKNFNKAVKIVTFGRKIESSENTENNVFEKAESFTSNVTKGANFRDNAKENNYIVRPITGIKILNETLTGIKNQRQIVNWVFKDDSKIGDVKRFDTDNGYVVVQLTSARKKGLVTLQQARFRVRRLLFEQKKAKYIKNGMGDMPLADIAIKFNTNVKNSLSVSLGSPVISTVGRSPGLIGALNASKQGDILRGVKTKSGVFAVKIVKRIDSKELPNYDAFRKQMLAKLKLSSFIMYGALEKETEIIDNRALYY